MTTAPPAELSGDLPAAPPPATAAPGPEPAAAARESGPARAGHGPRAWLRRSRWWLLTVLVLLLLGGLVAGIPGSSAYSAFDPRSGDPNGTRAADQLLRRHGITSRTAAGPTELAAALRADDTTVVLTAPDELAYQDLAELTALPRGARSRLVLVAPEQPLLNAFATGVSLSGHSGGSGTVTDPSCPLPEAVNAGPATVNGQSYQGRPGDTECYRATLLSRTRGDQQVVLLGSGTPLTNRALDQEGNAALALGLLGAHPRLVWQTPDGHDSHQAATERRSLGDYVPDGWYWGTFQLALAGLFAVAWRARRLGPVLTERLPAVVRASETTEGRARLYHRAGARDHAAETLRRAARRRTAAALGLPHTSGDPDPAALTAAAAARLGRPSADLQHLLYGPAPTDDAALLRLADDLDDMEWQVRQP
ncbi:MULTISPECIES: DUF4350 domain-containing protein [Kitasatospora]|uniref:DUF4350 domain-containing protein n=1 Tax=Kitasatospora setae (strain ATCC 33774 / DSM 43861 / JCM 3304 / KCC A-0304 / NBRC 14216 / KM-6054) TaxID=452652 RepID=E4NC03_KITSK|nr:MULTISPECIES: DUF4350 domain-containing protein [Kitasatospora]BAJ28734.1 hypothetical protein KSE_29230 [Kitasatospora setae KM-6054]